MADITVYKPEGLTKYSEIKTVSVRDGVLTFLLGRDEVTQTARQITTNLPFFVEQTVGV